MGTHVTAELLRKIQRKLKDVEKLEFQSETDSTGEPAVWIWIVLKPDARQAAWSRENRQKIRESITEELKKAGVTDWPYVRFRDARDETPLPSVSST